MTRITVAQLSLSIDDHAANTAAIAQAVRTAPGGIVVLPELVASGYCFRDTTESRAAAEPLCGPTYQLLHSLAQETGSTIVAGIAELDGAVYNTALVVDSSGLRGSYRKGIYGHVRGSTLHPVMRRLRSCKRSTEALVW
ncbi:MAG: nitrilase-related carbon-nitrogen hydrolase [Comamonas sp.]